jgi:hypothetical protein
MDLERKKANPNMRPGVGLPRWALEAGTVVGSPEPAKAPPKPVKAVAK